jgi:hypothetical protein
MVNGKGESALQAGTGGVIWTNQSSWSTTPQGVGCINYGVENKGRLSMRSHASSARSD